MSTQTGFVRLTTFGQAKDESIMVLGKLSAVVTTVANRSHVPCLLLAGEVTNRKGQLL